MYQHILFFISVNESYVFFVLFYGTFVITVEVMIFQWLQ